MENAENRHMCEMIRQEICYPNLNVKIACSTAA